MGHLGRKLLFPIATLLLRAWGSSSGAVRNSLIHPPDRRSPARLRVRAFGRDLSSRRHGGTVPPRRHESSTHSWKVETCSCLTMRDLAKRCPTSGLVRASTG